MKTRKLFSALTRDPQFKGVSYQMMILTGLGSVMVFLATGNLLGLLVGVPFYLIARIVNKKDHQLMAVILKKYQKTPPIPNNQFWGGSNSYDVNINNDKN